MIIGDQLLPHLICGLDETLKTQNILLLHTPDRLNAAKRLATVFQKYHIQPHLLEIQSAFNPEHIQQDLNHLKTWLTTHLPQHRPTLNFTIGTKLQAVLYTQFAQKQNWHITYLNNQDQLIWLNPQNIPPHDLQDRITLEDALLIHNYRILKQQKLPQTPAYIQVTQNIIDRLEHLQNPLKTLNYLAFKAQNLKLPPLKNTTNHMQTLLALFIKSGFIKNKNNQLTFTSPQAKFFANGGWLEVHLAHHIQKLSQQLPQLQDHAMGLEVENITTGVKNELDNVILYNNTLHIIECKTKNFKKNTNPDGDGAQALYKLDTLADFIGGAFAKTMLATIFPLTKSDQKRAQQYQIELLTGTNIKHTQTKLKNWLTTSPSQQPKHTPTPS